MITVSFEVMFVYSWTLLCGDISAANTPRDNAVVSIVNEFLWGQGASHTLKMDRITEPKDSNYFIIHLELTWEVVEALGASVQSEYELPLPEFGLWSQFNSLTLKPYTPSEPWGVIIS